MPRTTVLLADDHAMVREELVRLLQEEGFDVVAAVGDSDLLRDRAIQFRPDVIVTDVSMPGPSVFDVLNDLKTAGLDCKVVVLTMQLNPHLPAQAISAGASGYVLKSDAGKELPIAIREVLQNGVYLRSASDSP
jgi:DNA-binding NarL/FixJ family response regulator